MTRLLHPSPLSARGRLWEATTEVELAPTMGDAVEFFLETIDAITFSLLPPVGAVVVPLALAPFSWSRSFMVQVSIELPTSESRKDISKQYLILGQSTYVEFGAIELEAVVKNVELGGEVDLSSD